MNPRSTPTTWKMLFSKLKNLVYNFQYGSQTWSIRGMYVGNNIAVLLAHLDMFESDFSIALINFLSHVIMVPSQSKWY